MDAVKYLKEKQRYYKSDGNGMPVYIVGGFSEFRQPQNAVEFIAKWSKEHPRMTYKEHFLKAFPNALLRGKNAIPSTCRENVYGNGCPSIPCDNCWNEPFDESKNG